MQRLTSQNCVTLIIDMQEKLVPHMNGQDTLLQNVAKLIKGSECLGVPVMFTQQYTKGLGQTLPELAALASHFTYTEKTAFSCCGEQNFTELLNKTDRKTVIVAGIESHVCVLQTVLDLINKGFTVFVVSDAVSSRKLTDYQPALQRMMQQGAILTSTESVLFEILGSASASNFKQISQIVR